MSEIQYPRDQEYPPTFLAILMRENGAAVGGLVIGIFSMIAWLLPIIGIPISFIGIVLACLDLHLSHHRILASVNLVLCSIALVLALLNAAVGAMKVF